MKNEKKQVRKLNWIAVLKLSQLFNVHHCYLLFCSLLSFYKIITHSLNFLAPGRAELSYPKSFPRLKLSFVGAECGRVLGARQS